MLAGATQRSDSDPYDQISQPVAIGPHWMIMWAFDANAIHVNAISPGSVNTP